MWKSEKIVYGISETADGRKSMRMTSFSQSVTFTVRGEARKADLGRAWKSTKRERGRSIESSKT